MEIIIDYYGRLLLDYYAVTVNADQCKEMLEGFVYPITSEKRNVYSDRSELDIRIYNIYIYINQN